MAKSLFLADDSSTIRRIVELTFADSDFRVESVRRWRESPGADSTGPGRRGSGGSDHAGSFGL